MNVVSFFMIGDRRFCESQQPGKLLPFIQAAFLEELTLRYAKEDWLKIYDEEVTYTYNMNGSVTNLS